MIQFLLLLAATFQQNNAAADVSPNIIIILADDLGWNDVSFHGSNQIPTPHIDSLAHHGIVLNNYYVQQLCTPSRGALLTGKHPIQLGLQHGVISSAQPYGLGLNETILPQYLKKLGYSTHIVGKWHLGFFADQYTPRQRGFDTHYGYYMGAEDYLTHFSEPNGPADNRSCGLDFRNNSRLLYDLTGNYSTELFTQRAVEIISYHDRSKPLFLYLPHQAVHSGVAQSKTPLEAPQKYIDRVKHIADKQRRLYAAMVTALDDSVGAVLAALERREMLDNAVVLFSTDNGGPAHNYDNNHASNWPLRGIKNTLWEGGLRGAGVLWSPLISNTPRLSNSLVHVTDWLPTLLHAAGYDMSSLPKDLFGIDMWKQLQDGLGAARTEILHNIDPKNKAFAMRVHDMKLVYDVRGDTSLYDGWYEPEEFTSRSESKTDGRPSTDTPLFAATDALNRTAGVMPQVGSPTVRCKNFVYFTDCHPDQAPCLFNITSDPCEYNNLATSRPELVDELLTRVKHYHKIMVDPLNKPVDDKGLPYHHNGTWVPWVKL